MSEKTNKEALALRAIIERFEGGKAVLLLGEKEETQVVWPRQFLPGAAKEGDILKVNFQIDTVATAAANAEVGDLLQQLLNKNKQEPGK